MAHHSRLPWSTEGRVDRAGAVAGRAEASLLPAAKALRTSLTSLVRRLGTESGERSRVSRPSQDLPRTFNLPRVSLYSGITFLVLNLNLRSQNVLNRSPSKPDKEPLGSGKFLTKSGETSPRLCSRWAVKHCHTEINLLYHRHQRRPILDSDHARSSGVFGSVGGLYPRLLCWNSMEMYDILTTC